MTEIVACATAWAVSSLLLSMFVSTDTAVTFGAIVGLGVGLLVIQETS